MEEMKEQQRMKKKVAVLSPLPCHEPELYYKCAMQVMTFIKETFETFDADNSGTLDKAQLPARALSQCCAV